MALQCLDYWDHRQCALVDCGFLYILDVSFIVDANRKKKELRCADLLTTSEEGEAVRIVCSP